MFANKKDDSETFKYPKWLPILVTIMEHNNYTPIKLPNSLIEEVDEFVANSNLFTTRAGFVRYVIQHHLDKNNGSDNNVA